MQSETTPSASQKSETGVPGVQDISIIVHLHNLKTRESLVWLLSVRIAHWYSVWRSCGFCWIFWDTETLLQWPYFFNTCTHRYVQKKWKQSFSATSIKLGNSDSRIRVQLFRNFFGLELWGNIFINFPW